MIKVTATPEFIADVFTQRDFSFRCIQGLPEGSTLINMCYVENMVEMSFDDGKEVITLLPIRFEHNNMYKYVPVEKINDWFERLDALINTEVPYDTDQLVMANKTIERMREDAIELINQINMYTDL